MREPRALHRCLASLALLASLGACDEDAPVSRAPAEDEPPASATLGALGPSQPPAPTDACAHDLAERTPPEVRATLGDLGYDALFDDVCIVQRAEAAHDTALCAALSVSTLRERCVTRVAIASQHPMDCPAARTLEGRDPLCVALAARDRRLCVVAGPLERAICESALGRERACAHLPDESRDACVSRAADLRSRAQGEVRTTPAIETSFVLTLPDGTTRTTTSADRGARLTHRGCTRVLVLGDAAHLAAPFHTASVGLSVVAPDDGAVHATWTSLADDTASTLALTLDGMRTLRASGGTVSIDEIDPTLGAPVEGTFHAALVGEPASIDGTFHTFVRDVDARPAECGPAS